MGSPHAGLIGDGTRRSTLGPHIAPLHLRVIYRLGGGETRMEAVQARVSQVFFFASGRATKLLACYDFTLLDRR